MNLEMTIVSSLEKVYKSKEASTLKPLKKLSGLRGETISFQLDYVLEHDIPAWGQLSVEGPLAHLLRIRQVELMPVTRPKDFRADGDYLETEPCAMPDLLKEADLSFIPLIPGYHRSLWVDVEIPFGQGEDTRLQTDDPKDVIPAGTYNMEFTLTPLGEGACDPCKASIRIEIIDARLPELTLCHTEWFYGDCIANYYGIEPMSEAFFRVCRNFIRTAAKRNINTMLTPIFTPALDTAVGGERRTVQLVDVTVTGEDTYSFDFKNLERWIRMCLEEGIRFFEMAHLFTQWGCKCAPKILGQKEGETVRLFGWETDALSPKYASFLKQFLPALKDKLEEMGVLEHTFLHLSDEPGEKDRDTYEKVNHLVRSIVPGFKILDAMSDVEFYKRGLIDVPACATDHIGPFLKEMPENLWAYYCCAQGRNSANRFMAMPSARNRVLGLQLYRYKLQGFLHWGYNYYNCMYSYHSIDPYRTVDAEGGVPAGDPFLVYPGRDQVPEESIRLMVLDEAFNDVRALNLLESLTSYEETVALITAPLNFSHYPMEGSFYTELREKVNEAIARHIKR
ncbi:MAG: DUF4091 domain-containing protein [Lachnospiraceae bacterium]|nr:DUF4091 domain-containing protein [Lachnospiraceae bacterium]